ncbi:MAG: response regulator transcription factor [Pseudomonadota bacterium]|nr:MAG: DNA-binding response regulator [Pseudomonadota bacterium]
MRIALLEDDPSQRDLVKLWLDGAGHVCHAFSRSRDFMRILTRDTFDLLLIDWELPDINGDRVLEWVRANVRQYVPVMFATARAEEEDICSILRAGADDYLVKPLRKNELLARVDALGRRSKPPLPNNEPLRVGDFEIDFECRVLRRKGVPVLLTQKDFDLAVFLFRNVGNLLSRGHILETVWGRNPDLNTRTVDTHISRLRSKLGLTPENGWRLSAVYQQGYRLEPVAERDAAVLARRSQKAPSPPSAYASPQ